VNIKKRPRTARTSTKKVNIQKGANGLTTQAGLIPVVKFLQKQDIKSIILETLEHARGSNALYDAFDAIFICIIGIVGGARSMSGIITVWADVVLCRIAGWIRIPHETTLSRLIRTFHYRNVNNLEIVVHKMRGRIWKKALRNGTSMVRACSCHIIDVDSTVKTVYGNQEGAAKGYNPHKRGAKSYHPLLAFSAVTKEILQGWLRSGDVYTSAGIVEFMKQLLAHMPDGMRIIFRGDSGFFLGTLLDFLEKNGHGYLIKVKLKNLVQLLAGQAWEKVPGHPGWEQCSFWHRCANWRFERRFVAVRRLKEREEQHPVLFEVQEYDYFCYVLTEDMTPWEAHNVYGKRATCETWIEEAKNQMALAHIKTDDFWASSVLFQCSVLAYNTVRWMGLCSKNIKLRRWEPSTIRTFLIRVAGKLTSGSRQLKLSVPDRMLHMKEWDVWIAFVT
jgi:hypothetical protein